MEFPFWESLVFPAHACAHPFTFAIGRHTIDWGLALVGMYCNDICLGYETFFGSPDTGPDNLASWVGAEVIIPSPHVLQVSSILDTC